MKMIRHFFAKQIRRRCSKVSSTKIDLRKFCVICDFIGVIHVFWRENFSIRPLCDMILCEIEGKKNANDCYTCFLEEIEWRKIIFLFIEMWIQIDCFVRDRSRSDNNFFNFLLGEKRIIFGYLWVDMWQGFSNIWWKFSGIFLREWRIIFDWILLNGSDSFQFHVAFIFH